MRLTIVLSLCVAVWGIRSPSRPQTFRLVREEARNNEIDPESFLRDIMRSIRKYSAQLDMVDSSAPEEPRFFHQTRIPEGELGKEPLLDQVSLGTDRMYASSSASIKLPANSQVTTALDQ